MKVQRSWYSIKLCIPATPLNDANHGGLFVYMHQSYVKPALAIDALLAQLKQQALIIHDNARAAHCLRAAGYHRLSSYFDPFRISNSNQPQFKTGVTFEEIWDLYLFDRELRLLVTKALELIEVAFRVAISETMSLKHGTHWYLEPAHFKNQQLYYGMIKHIGEVCELHDDPAVKKYFAHYNHPELPPSWVIIENLSFGTCTNIFRNIKTLGDKKAICEIFQYHPTAIESWIYALRYVRNICAHHSRLWNRWFVVSPKMSYLFGSDFKKEKTFYAQAIIIEKLSQSIEPKLKWKNELYELLKSCRNVPITQMGFSSNWQAEELWRL